MNRAEELYAQAVAAPDLTGFIAALPLPDLTGFIAALPLPDLKELHGHLLHCYDESGISGLIFGVVLVDCAARLMKGGGK